MVPSVVHFLLWVCIMITSGHCTHVTGKATVQNFTCIKEMKQWIRTRDTHIYLHWDLSETIAREHGTNKLLAIIRWQTDGGGSIYEGCTRETLTSCQWTYWDAKSPNFDSVLDVNIKVIDRDTKTAIAEGSWIVDLRDCTKPPKIDQLQVKTLANGCLNISWSYDEYSIPTIRKLFKIEFTSKWDNNITRLEFRQEGAHVLCDLAPYTVYTFMVKCSQTNSSGHLIGYWSDVTMTTVTTPENISEVGPPLTSGCFVVNSEFCSTTNTWTARVYVMEVPERLSNGIIQSYHVEKRDIISGETTVYDVNDVLTPYFDVTASCTSQVRLQVWSITKIGKSKSPSKMVIPKYSAVLPSASHVIPDVIDANDDTRLRVSWIPAHSGRHDDSSPSYTVYQCSKSAFGECDGGFSWTHVPNGSSSVDIYLPTTSSKSFHGSYLIGVSMEIGNSSSGIRWTDCRYDPHIAPLALTGVKVISDIGPVNSLTITWDKPFCTVGRLFPFIQSYIMRACPQPDKVTSCTEKLLNSSLHRVAIDDLVTDISYNVSIISVTREGNQSLPSRPIVAQPYKGRHTQESVGIEIIIPLGIPVLLFLFLALLMCLCKLHKRFRLQRVPISEVPMSEVPISEVSIFID